MEDRILYKRPKQSDMMQGISDAIRAISLEIDRMRKFGYYSPNGYPIETSIRSMENTMYQWDQEADQLRKKGL